MFRSLSLIPGTDLLKSLDFLNDRDERSIFVIHNKPLSTLPEFMLMSSLLRDGAHYHSRGERGWRLSSITNSVNVNNHAYVMELP